MDPDNRNAFEILYWKLWNKANKIYYVHSWPSYSLGTTYALKTAAEAWQLL